MTNKLDSLSDAEVRQISQLIETLDKSALDYLELDAGNFKVTISKGAPPPPSHASSPVTPAPQAAAPSAQAAPAAPAPASAPAKVTAPDDGNLRINAPLMGRFYSKPEPGAEPFVTVGSQVSEDTPVCLIEVMKLFNTVQAGVRGVVTEVCIPDGAVDSYIRWYNEKRIQISLGSLSPLEYRESLGLTA